MFFPFSPQRSFFQSQIGKGNCGAESARRGRVSSVSRRQYSSKHDNANNQVPAANLNNDAEKQKRTELDGEKES